jgi:hypothetical protein
MKVEEKSKKVGAYPLPITFYLITLAHSLPIKQKFDSCEHSVSIPAGFLVTGTHSFFPIVISDLSILEKKGEKKNW